MRDYVDVYQQAIDGLTTQIDVAQVEFEIISEEKRLRDEQEAAIAAQKAKENEFSDMKKNFDEAKVAKSNAEAELKKVQKQIEECGEEVTGDCALEEALANAQAEFDFATMDYDMVNETF